MLEPTRKNYTPCSRTKKKLKQDSRRGTIMFNIKPHIHQRLLEGTNKTLCAPGPKERSSDYHKRLSQTCLCMFDDLLCGHGSAVACHRDRGTGNRSSGRHCVWCKSSWRRSPLGLAQRLQSFHRDYVLQKWAALGKTT